MKFTNGYWLLRENITALYAVEYSDHYVDGEELVVYAAEKPVTSRGATVGTGLLTIRISSPMVDVIHVKMDHFMGVADPGPFAQVNHTNPAVTITEDESCIRFMTGRTGAVIDKRPSMWSIRFYDGERELTETGYRNMAHMTDRMTGQTYMVEQLSLGVGESVYGLGERFTPFVKNGQTVEMWNEDGGTASEIAYKNIPFYVSNRGYGVLVDHEGDVAYEIGSEKVERVQFSVKGEHLAYYVINGQTPKGTIRKYTDLTGKPALPPAWSFGLWLSTSFTTDYDEKTTSYFLQEMADREIPVHVFHFDCFWMKGYEWCNFTWDPDIFPDPQKMLARYHEKGLKICVWINPYIAQKSPLFAEGMSLGYLLKKKNGDVWQTNLWQAGMALVDFTNPDAAAWYQSKLKKLLDMGVDCFKTDFGERVPVRDIAWYDGSDPVKMHNYYTHLYNKCVFELLQQERGAQDAVLFARSATVGGQQFPAHWGGDSTADYRSMAETLRGGLSLACAGFGFWSHDISGFENTAPADLYKRWLQFGLLSSHSRLHGSSSYRVPWLFDEEACEVTRKFSALKCALMPYLYRQAVISHTEGVPMLRPMFVEFPDDRTCAALDLQYMLGDSLLVAPIFQESGDVEYYAPEGNWVNLLTDQRIIGGHWQKEHHDYFSLPLLVREGTILAMGACRTKPDYEYEKDVTLYITYLADGQSAHTTVCDVHGKEKMNVTAHRKGDTVTVSVEGGDGSYRCELLGWGEKMTVI